YIGERAFEGCPNINFKYEKDSYAEKYAKKYKEQNEKSFINTARIFCLGNIRVGKKFNMQEFNEIKYFLTCGDIILGNLEIPKEMQINKNRIINKVVSIQLEYVFWEIIE